MKFHGEDIEIGDRVYDVSVGRGYGYIIMVDPDTNLFQVKFPTFSVNYNSDGTQQSRNRPTLYWSKPHIIAPIKDEQNTYKKRQLVESFFDLVRDYSEFI